MQLQEKIEYIVEVFEMLKNPKCNEMFCSTCGGHVGKIAREINQFFPSNTKIISEVLSVATLDEFDKFGIWTDALESINLNGVISVYIRESRKINLSNIGDVDRFLLKARKINKFNNSEFSPLYKKILERGISLALITLNESLVETIVIVLEGRVKDYPELVDLAIETGKNNKQMKRVLYNFLREDMPEVRGYVGRSLTQKNYGGGTR